MSIIMPEGELLRRAAAWICDQRVDQPTKDVFSLVDEAGMRFNLSPKDQRMLAKLFSHNECPCDSSTSRKSD